MEKAKVLKYIYSMINPLIFEISDEIIVTMCRFLSYNIFSIFF